MDALLEQVLRRPDLPKLKREIDHIVDAEAKCRKAFYDALTDGDRHEFINGEMVMASPQRLEHGETIENLYDRLRDHVRMNGLGRVLHTNYMVRCQRNDYHPDVCFWRKEIADTFTPKQTIFPPPDFIAEVLSESTEARDRGVKFEDYAANGVREYWIIDPATSTVEQYLSDDDARYALRRKLDAGMLPSEVIQGFTLAVAEVLAG